MSIFNFVQDKLTQSIDEIVEEINPSPIDTNVKSSLRAITGTDNIIDSKAEALDLAREYLEKYPHVLESGQYQFTHQDISNYRKHMNVEISDRDFSENEIRAELDRILDILDNPSSSGNTQFLGQNIDIEVPFSYHTINQLLRDRGSKYRCLLDAGASVGFYGRVIDEKIIRVGSQSIFQISLQVERRLNFPTGRYGMNDHVNSSFGFQKSIEDRVRRRVHEFESDELFQYKTDEQSVLKDQASDLIVRDDEWKKHAAKLVASHEAGHIENAHRYAQAIQIVKITKTLDIDGMPSWLIMDELLSNLYAFEDIIEQSEISPEDAKNRLALLYIQNYISYDPDPGRKFSLYNIQIYSMIIILSAFELDSRGRLVINLDKFRDAVKDLNKIFHEAYERADLEFKKILVELHKNDIEFNEGEILDDRYERVIKEIYVIRFKKESPNIQHSYLIERGAAQLAVNHVIDQNSERLQKDVIDGPNIKALGLMRNYLINHLGVNSDFLPDISSDL